MACETVATEHLEVEVDTTWVASRKKNASLVRAAIAEFGQSARGQQLAGSNVPINLQITMTVHAAWLPLVGYFGGSVTIALLKVGKNNAMNLGKTKLTNTSMN